VTDKRSGRAPALFDDASFAEDLARASEPGREVALAARETFESDGVPVASLLLCAEEGPDGTALAHCLKLRLPPPEGKFGMVFRIEKREGRSMLVFIAFGVRHHPPDSNAPSVYEIAHRRLHGQYP
jgi:hypothetical protein